MIGEILLGVSLLLCILGLGIAYYYGLNEKSEKKLEIVSYDCLYNENIKYKITVETFSGEEEEFNNAELRYELEGFITVSYISLETDQEECKYFSSGHVKEILVQKM